MFSFVVYSFSIVTESRISNYLYIYDVRLLPHSLTASYVVLLSPIGLSCPGVNINPVSNLHQIVNF